MSDIDDLDEFNELANDGYEYDYEENDFIDEENDFIDEDVEVALSEVDEENKIDIRLNAKMWASHGNVFTPCETSVTELPAACYVIEQSHSVGLYFKKIVMNLDELIHLPDSASESVINNIEDFWEKEQAFRDFKFLWKRGVLMWGPPGSGKTSTLHLIIDRIIKRDGIAVFVNEPHIVAEGLRLLRTIEPTRPLVVILEDLDAITKYHGESALLALLDGETQIDNVVFIATTNYPERLDRRIINRPSRFDVIKKIGMPNEAARRVFLETKNPHLKEDEEELLRWVEATEDFSIAHIKELIVLVEVFGNDFEESVKRLQAMMGGRYSSEDYNERGIGFSSNM